MKTFKNLEEMRPYYNGETNTYEFIENGRPIDIRIDFDLYLACNINAKDINACDINAWDINARNIDANKILFLAVCFAYKTFVCNSIKGTRINSKHFCLDSEIVIKGDKKNVK